MKLTQWKSPIKESATLAINQKVKAARAQNQTISHFGFGESPFPVHPKIQQTIAEHKHEKTYLPGLGLPALRQSIAQFQNKYFSHSYTAEHIAIGPGSKELIFQALMLLEGDLLLPAASWVSYQPQAHLINKKVIPIHTDYDTGYKITQANLEAALAQTESTQKILILNSPSNPTGQVYDTKQLQQLAQWCKTHNIIVISDEIYALVGFEGPSPSMAQYLPEQTIVTSGLSKAFSAGGYRLGFLATQNTALIQQLAVIISETFSCVSAPIQYAALTAYSDDPDIIKYIQQCTNIHRIVLQYSAMRYQKMGLDCLNAQGGFYLFPDFKPYQTPLQTLNINTSKDLALYLLEHIQVAVLPGEDFVFPSNRLTTRVAMVDYNGTKVHQAYCNDPHFQNNLENHIPSITDGLNRLEHWLQQL